MKRRDSLWPFVSAVLVGTALADLLLPGVGMWLRLIYAQFALGLAILGVFLSGGPPSGPDGLIDVCSQLRAARMEVWS